MVSCELLLLKFLYLFFAHGVCHPHIPLNSRQAADNQSCILTLILSDYQNDFPVARVSDLFTQSYNHALKVTPAHVCTSTPPIPSYTTDTHTYKPTNKIGLQTSEQSPPSSSSSPSFRLHIKWAHDKKGLLSHTLAVDNWVSMCWECVAPYPDWPALLRLIGIRHYQGAHIKKQVFSRGTYYTGNLPCFSPLTTNCLYFSVFRLHPLSDNQPLVFFHFITVWISWFFMWKKTLFLYVTAVASMDGFNDSSLWMHSRT